MSPFLTNFQSKSGIWSRCQPAVHRLLLVAAGDGVDDAGGKSAAVSISTRFYHVSFALNWADSGSPQLPRIPVIWPNAAEPAVAFGADQIGLLKACSNSQRSCSRTRSRNAMFF